jgi:uncharacterized tellurite resistance protein B-like protein
MDNPMARNDPSTVAELLLLLRLGLSDGEPDAPIAAVMRRVALRDLDMEQEGLDEVLAEIEHLIAAAGAGAACAALRDLPADRRRELAGHIDDIAARDEAMSRLSARLAARIGLILGVEPQSGG